MYYSCTQHFNNKEFICNIQNESIDQLQGDSLAQTVGKKGFVSFAHPTAYDKLKQFALEVGYYLSEDLPPHDVGKYHSCLTYYPDNEEMLIIYNDIQEDIKISVCNTTQLPKDIVHWNRWNLYDDVWGTVYNDNLLPSCAKNITKAINFEQKNTSKYLPIRINDTHKLKIFPRHPMWTECMFAPKDMIDLTVMTKDQVENIAEAIPGFTGHPLDERYCKEFVIKPQSFVIIDQIITQWKMISHSKTNLKFIPLWYKTKIRKHFNYSI
jgi:hypothetical protein